jgi:hypothetical protein
MSKNKSALKKADKAPAMPGSAKTSSIDFSERGYGVFCLLLMILAAITAASINFPAGDSWTHGWTVRRWVQDIFILNQWASTLALPQQILGWLLSIGTTGDDLPPWSRLSILTAVVTVAGCLLAARLPSKLYPSWPALKQWSPLLAIVALAPPFTLKSAAGFLTDGYYLFFLTAALWLLVSALNEPGQSDSTWLRRWVGFTAMAVLASLQRTHGLVLLFIVALWILFARLLDKKGKTIDPLWAGWKGWLPFILISAGFAFSLYVIMLPQFHTIRGGEVQSEIIAFWTGSSTPLTAVLVDRIKLIFGIFQHFGFALLPLALIVRLDKSASEQQAGKARINWWYVVGGTAFIAMTLALYARGTFFPYLGNSITPEGFGPRTDTIALTAGNQMDHTWRMALTVIGTLGGMVLIWILSRTSRIRGIDWRAPSTLIGLLGLAHLGLVFLNPNFFDRYLIPLIPFVFIWLAPMLKDIPPKARSIGWVIVLLFLVWSTYGTADYLDWTKDKWDLASTLRTNYGLRQYNVIGGYEPDGMFYFNNNAYATRQELTRNNWPWWNGQLNLGIKPDFVIVEVGSKPLGALSDYRPAHMGNLRFEVWVAPGIASPGDVEEHVDQEDILLNPLY